MARSARIILFSAMMFVACGTEKETTTNPEVTDTVTDASALSLWRKISFTDCPSGALDVRNGADQCCGNGVCTNPVCSDPQYVWVPCPGPGCNPGDTDECHASKVTIAAGPRGGGGYVSLETEDQGNPSTPPGKAPAINISYTDGNSHEITCSCSAGGRENHYTVTCQAGSGYQVTSFSGTGIFTEAGHCDNSCTTSAPYVCTGCFGKGVDGTITCNMQYCGDGSVNGPETCDDGNTLNCDGCTSCSSDAGLPGNTCDDLFACSSGVRRFVRYTSDVAKLCGSPHYACYGGTSGCQTGCSSFAAIGICTSQSNLSQWCSSSSTAYGTTVYTGCH